MMMPSITEMPNSAINPIAAETLNGMCSTNNAKTPPTPRHGDTAHGQERVRQRAKIDPQQERDQGQRDGHHAPEASDRILQIAEFADPFEARARRQLHLLGDLALRLLDRAAEIA